MNLVLENLLEPKLVGSTLRLHPLVVLVSTVAGGLLIGIVGLILASPTVAISLNLFRKLRGSGFFATGGPPVVAEPVVADTEPRPAPDPPADPAPP